MAVLDIAVADSAVAEIARASGRFRRDEGVAASPFRTFFMGGFEGSTHRRADGRQLDLVAATRHDAMAAVDYGLLAGCGVGSVRDAFRWHLIERETGVYDWSSVLPMIRAAREAGVQVLWDLCHYGVPPGLDVFSREFPRRFQRFAAAAARLLVAEGESAPVVCPVNEISFWAWAGGDQAYMYPHAERRGRELKRQLVRATIGAVRAVRAVAPGARWLMAEPLIHVAVPPGASEMEARDAGRHHLAQFEAFDMVAGRRAPELGGAEALLDLVGLNYYPHNQFFRGGETIPLGHGAMRPLRDMLLEVHARYGRPMLLSETGEEAEDGPGWLAHVAGEVRAAMAAGVPMQGVCLYPVMDYPGWTDERHCRCGLLRVGAGWGARSVDLAMLGRLEAERSRAGVLAGAMPGV